MEAPSVAKGNDEKSLKSLLEEIGFAFCKADQEANLAGEILCGNQKKSISVDATYQSKGLTDCAPYYHNGYGKCYANRNSPKVSKLKRNPASVGTISGVVGKDYAWHIAGSNNDPNLKVKAAPLASDSSVYWKKCVGRIAGSNGAPYGKTPLKVESNGFTVLMKSYEKVSHSRDANSGSSERSSSESNASMNDEIESFLYGMLGSGFQLERSTIKQVLGRCGYDMKKSLETLLDLMALNLDKRSSTSLCEGNNLHTNSNSCSSVKQVRKQNSYVSNGSRTMRSNLIPSSRHSSEEYEQKKEGLTAPFHVPKQPDLTEPLNDNAEDFDMKDDAEEGSYSTLRKAVKEHRDTMKEYYKAAAEAFARGDRDRALLLLEKGQFFYNKAREADEESSTKIFETSDNTMNSKMQEEMSIDLQNHDAKEAIRLVKIHLRTLSGIPLVTNLKLNIGYGDCHAEKSKRLIIKLLEKEAINWVEDENAGAIFIRLDEIDPKTLSFCRKSQQKEYCYAV